MLGHASAAMTLDTYADLFDDDLDAVAVGLDTARSSRIVSMSVSMAPKPSAKEPLPPLVSRDVGVVSLAVPVGFVPGLETPLDATRLMARPWAHPGALTNANQSTN